MRAVYAKAPLRISLGGGGSDLPSYLEHRDGFVLAGAIDKYVYLLVHAAFQQRWLMQYSETEDVAFRHEIKNPILRSALDFYWLGPPLHIASVADVPKGTGLGSSGTFTVCLLKALHYASRRASWPRMLAEQASQIEIHVLGEPVGKQDTYASAHGGINVFHFHQDGSTMVEPLELNRGTLDLMNERLLLYYTGVDRAAASILSDQDERTRSADAEMIENLDQTVAIGRRAVNLLLGGDLDGYGELLDEHWQTKKRRSPNMTSSWIDQMYATAKAAGALGGKIVGAGGGGFLLVYSPEPERTRQAMQALEVAELPFAFEFGGAWAGDA